MPAGALRDDKQLWFQKSAKFLLPEKPLAQLFRGKFLAGLKALGLPFSAELYQIDWVVHGQAVGQEENAFEYLSKYLYRGVISESQIISDQQGQITFTYTESQAGEKKTRTLPGAQFLRLILQHVLPQGFRRARDYGFLHGNARKTLNRLKLILKIKVRLPANPLTFKIKCRRCNIPLKWCFPSRRENVFPQRASPAH
ncbi:MAG: transposase [Desulfamplus sp.]|nr:transposase [Desulfamplus sp.]